MAQLLHQTYHVYKADCFQASRLFLQSSWDANPVFLHIPAGAKGQGSTIPSGKLSLKAIARLVLDRTHSTTLVFHAQSSLPYLLFTCFVRALFRQRRIRLVYDIHDLHEKPVQVTIGRAQRKVLVYREQSSLCCFLCSYIAGILCRGQNVRLAPSVHVLGMRCAHGPFHIWLRYHILRFLERFVLQNRNVSPMTVSAGLARLVQEKYKARALAVIRSVPKIKREAAHRDRGLNRSQLVFFGRGEWAPLEVVAQLAKSQVELHLYGRDIPSPFLSGVTDEADRQFVRYCGEYRPENLSFLERYTFSLLFRPSDSDNLTYSLPNKLFQALAYGLTVIVSENFREMIELFRDVPGAIEVWDGREDIREVMGRACQNRGLDYEMRIQRALAELHAEARQIYLSICGHVPSMQTAPLVKAGL